MRILRRRGEGRRRKRREGRKSGEMCERHEKEGRNEVVLAVAG